MPQSYRYFALLSYSSKDEETVEKLHEQIETYRLPVILRNEPEDSKHLIVTCSPSSAKLSWINQEIENYILMGRYEQIVLYLIDGIPNSTDPKKESLPPILRKKPEFLHYECYTEEENQQRQKRLRESLADRGEPKTISISKEGDYVARMKVIATMLDVKPDALIRQDRQRQKQEKYWNIGIVTTILFLICISLYAWNRYNHIHNEHAEYVEHIRYVSEDNRANYIERQEMPEERRNVTEQTFLIVDSDLRFIKDGCTKLICKYNERGNIIEQAYFDTNGQPFLNKEGYARFTFKYDEHGNEIERAFFGVDGKPVAINSDDPYDSWTATYYENGKQKTKTWFYSIKQHPDGYDKFTVKYDEHGNIMEIAFFGADGRLCLNKEGYAKSTAVFDERGNMTEVAFFDADSKLCLNKEGYAKSTAAFDERGNITEQSHFDMDGNELLGMPVIQEVFPDSQAESLDLQVGDIFISYDGKELNSVSDLITHNRTDREDDIHKLVVLRDEKTLEFELKAGMIGVRLGIIAVSPEMMKNIDSQEKPNDESDSPENPEDADLTHEHLTKEGESDS